MHFSIEINLCVNFAITTTGSARNCRMDYFCRDVIEIWASLIETKSGSIIEPCSFDLWVSHLRLSIEQLLPGVTAAFVFQRASRHSLRGSFKKRDDRAGLLLTFLFAKTVVTSCLCPFSLVFSAWRSLFYSISSLCQSSYAKSRPDRIPLEPPLFLFSHSSSSRSEKRTTDAKPWDVLHFRRNFRAWFRRWLIREKFISLTTYPGRGKKSWNTGRTRL